MSIRIVILLFLVGLENADGDPLKLAVNPSISRSPGAFRAIATIAPHAENRWLVLRMESSEYYRSSTVQLQGARAARTHEMFFERLPSGMYVIQARLERTNDELIIRRTMVEVVGPAGSR